MPKPKAPRHVHTRRRRKSKSNPWKRVTAALAVMAVTGGALAMSALMTPSGTGNPAMAAAAVEGPGRFEQILTAAGFGIDEVTVSGHRFTADTDIFDALDLPNVPTMAALQSAQVQARLRRLPWVATASLTRVYPGRIDVTITERTPFAAWSNGGKTVLVDATGRELSAVRAADWPALPRISGDGAPQAVTALFQMLAHFPAIANRLQNATRITQRRWQLELTNGVRLELPSEGEATALGNLLANDTASGWLDRAGSVIDLRSQSRIAARDVASANAVRGP